MADSEAAEGVDAVPVAEESESAPVAPVALTEEELQLQRAQEEAEEAAREAEKKVEEAPSSGEPEAENPIVEEGDAPAPAPEPEPEPQSAAEEVNAGTEEVKPEEAKPEESIAKPEQGGAAEEGEKEDEAGEPAGDAEPEVASDPKDELAEQEAAAIKIQAAARSKATRKKLAKEKQKKEEESAQSHWAESGLPDDRYLADGYYKRSQFDFDESIASTNVAGLSLKQGLGFDSIKRHNTMLVEEDVLIYSTGKFLVLHKYSVGTRLYLPSLDGGGIGSFDVHPSRKYICVCERVEPALMADGRTPNVYIYEYPSLRIYKVLQGGTERGFAACKFNDLDQGKTLATVGSYPDFLLSVWNWEEEKMILRSKAFSQDIYSVNFSPKFEGQLITSGTGHIRFWKMAGTFTGLKLQGAIGKFGSVEISDVAAFAELPDGSVACGTESGDILVWDGGFIKTFFTLPGGQPCHKGMIEVAQICKAKDNSQYLMTGGMDGYLKFWDLKQLMELESEDDAGINCTISPAKQCLMECPGRKGKAVAVKSVIEKGKDRYIVQDHNGAIIEVAARRPKEAADQEGTVDLAVTSSKAVMRCHSGNIVGLIPSPVSHHMVTAGEDGSVRVYNYTQDTTKSLFEVSFAEPATVLASAPKSVDPTGRIVIVGFADGVVRVLLRCLDGFKTLWVGKPHKDAVTSACVSPDGTYCVTGSKDKTLFFFTTKFPAILAANGQGPPPPKPEEEAGDAKSDDGTGLAEGEKSALEFKPLAYIPTPDEVSTVSWHGDSAVLLVGCTNGDILEVERPPQDVDTFKTFETQCKTRFYDFQKPKIKKLEPKEEEKEKGDEKKEGGDNEKEEGDKEKEEGEDEGGKEESSEEESSEDEASGYPVREIMYLTDKEGKPSSNFYAAFGGKASGYIYLCNVDEDEVLEYVPCQEMPMTHLSYSHKSKYMVLGSSNGIVRICSLESEKVKGATDQAGMLSDFVEVGMHGGSVSCVATSFDESVIVTAAEDGSCFIVKNFLEEETVESRIKIPKEPSVPLPTMMADELSQTSEEITSQEHYSIEESKQKTDRDKKVSNAESKKAALREKVAEIRAKFQHLLETNKSKSEVEQLSREEFLIDLNLQEMLDKKMAEVLNEIELEEAYESEKARIGLEKLQKWFFEDVEVERIELHAFKSKLSSSTFRTTKLPEEVKKELDDIKAKAKAKLAGEEEKETSEKKKPAEVEAPKTPGGAGSTKADQGDVQDKVAKKEDTHAREVEKKLNKQEMRREQRRKRDKEWEAFNATKPDEKFENPEDVAAIQTAIDTMGDFKLKSDPDYIAPEEERTNVDKKSRQLVLLDAKIHGIKMGFNNKFLALRELKKDLIKQIKASNTQLTKLRKELKQTEELFEPKMLVTETPETRYEVFAEEVKTFIENAATKAEGGAGGFGGGGFGGFGGGGAAKGKSEQKKAPSIGSAAKVLGFAKKIRRSSLAGERRFSAIAEFRASDVEIKEMLLNKRKLQHQVENIEGQIKRSVEDFDKNLDALRQEKFVLQGDLKMAEIRRIILVKELAILKECEKRDNLLINKMDTKVGENGEIVSKIKSCTEKILEKVSEIDKVHEKKSKILAEFDSLVEDGSTFREQLQKIFLRKIKRHKKNAKRTEDFDSEEESDSEEEDDDDDDWDEDEAEEICPPGCDQSLYEKVCDLREKRLDQEEIDVELKKQLETFNKEKESLKKKQNLINQAVKAINAEIISFQKEKQAKLNEIVLVVTLKMHQIEYLVESKLPLDLSEALVFPKTTLKRLEDRVGELIEEKAQLKQEQKELRKQHKQMLRDNKVKEGRINELQSKARDIQLLKFGQLIDLDLLDKMGVNKTTEDLKANLLRQEKQFIQDLAQWNKKIEMAKRELADFTQENTNYLNKLAELTSSQRQIDLKLHSTQNELFTNPAAQRKKEIAARDNLIEVINMQAQQIDSLKHEINVLRHKSGKL